MNHIGRLDLASTVDSRDRLWKAEHHIRHWNKPAEELWVLRRDEAVGQHFLNLDIGLPTDQLRPIAVRVVCSPSAEGGGHVTGVVLVMEGSDDVKPPQGGD